MTRRNFGSVRKLSTSGRYQARYVGPDGIRYNGPHGFTSKADASRFLAQTETAISKGTWVSPKAKAPANAVTLAAFFSEWLPARRTKTNTPLTPKTRNEYQGLFDRRLKDPFGTKLVTALDADAVRRWYRALNTDTPTENARAYTLLRTLLGSAVEEGMIKVNPCQIENAGRVTRKREIHVLSVESVKALAAAMPQRYRLLVLVTTFCCLRFGEVTELRKSDFDGAKLHIRRGVTWVGKPVVGTPKSEAGKRIVPVPTFLRSALSAHVADLGDDDLLFPAVSGGHLSQASLATVYNPARAAIGREDLTFHDLRHTGAVFWASVGATLKALMTLLGHSTPDMAMHYQHVAEDYMDKLAEAVSELAA